MTSAKRWRAAVAWAAFPSVLVAGLGSAIAALGRGVAPGLVMASTSAGAALCVIALERIAPHEPRWSRSRGDVSTDALHLVFSTLLPPQLVDLLLLGGVAYAGAALQRWIGSALWPVGWPLAAQLVAALVVGELGQYWVHRLSHEREILWRLHATHHSAERLYWLNAGRFHPLDTLLQYTSEVVPLALLGCPEPTLALFAVFTAIHGLFQHANIELRLGPLNWIFSMAELHRWHHSRTIRESNNNYGANLIVWDIVFATRFLPLERQPPVEIGIAGLDGFPRRFGAQLLSPFRWKTISGERVGADEPDGQRSAVIGTSTNP